MQGEKLYVPFSRPNPPPLIVLSSAARSEAAHVSFTVALDQLAQQLAKSKRIEQVAAWEIDSYRQEVASLGACRSCTAVSFPSDTSYASQSNQARRHDRSWRHWGRNSLRHSRSGRGG